MAHKYPECLPSLIRAGISEADAYALRRIAMTLHRWHELECGIDNGGVEWEAAFAIERAAWPASDRKRWWNGREWVRKSERATYESKSAECANPFPADGAWRDTGCKPLWYSSYSGERSPFPDRETPALARLAKIMGRYPSLSYYVQGDPRGAALYILRAGDVPAGEDVGSYYSRGLAVYK